MRIDYVGDINIMMNSIGSCYQNSTWATAFHVKNRRKTVGIEEKLDVIRHLEKG
jgi:hypothetical protein